VVVAVTSIELRLRVREREADQRELENWQRERAPDEHGERLAEVRALIKKCLDDADVDRRYFYGAYRRLGANRVHDFQAFGEALRSILTTQMQIHTLVMSMAATVVPAGGIDDLDELKAVHAEYTKWQEFLDAHWPWLNRDRLMSAYAALKDGNYTSTLDLLDALRHQARTAGG
jgi:hypothetical protein